MDMEIRHAKRLRGEVTVPGDKSISHRAVMLGAVAEGVTEVTNFLEGADCLSTVACFRSLGVSIQRRDGKIILRGRGLHGLHAPDAALDTGNAGTALRLMAGILSGQPFRTEITGDASIRRRPMTRIIEPLSRMGANIQSIPGNGCAPLSIRGGNLRGIRWRTPVASAQVKSALLLAGLYAEGPTAVTEPAQSRDHTERMLAGFGAEVRCAGDAEVRRAEEGASGGENTVTIYPGSRLLGQKVDVCGDISSAAYFIAAGLLVPGSEILIRNVGVNPTRDGILRAARAMGGRLELLNLRRQAGEPVADILVSSSPLHGTIIEKDLIPALIDELPVIAVMASLADGETVIRDAAELKVKESDRIQTVTGALRAMGCDVTPTPDGMVIRGGSLRGAAIDACRDHRIAMSFAVAGLAADGTTVIRGGEWMNISYPNFYRDLTALAEN